MKETTLESIDIASFIVKYCARSNYFINLTKLQKLLFCCYGAVLADSDTRICKEHPRAWEHGPVFPKVYKVTSKNRDGFVQMLIEYPDHTSEQLTPEQIGLMKNVIDVFSPYMAGQLVAWTHRPGSPWSKTVEAKGLHSFMDDKIIKEYFLQHVVDKAVG